MREYRRFSPRQAELFAEIVEIASKAYSTCCKDREAVVLDDYHSSNTAVMKIQACLDSIECRSVGTYQNTANLIQNLSVALQGANKGLRRTESIRRKYRALHRATHARLWTKEETEFLMGLCSKVTDGDVIGVTDADKQNARGLQQKFYEHS
jgi:hypothetical protein